MSTDASVRIRLDTSGARADLNALYGDIRRAPAVSLPGGGAGGGSGGGGVGSGGFDMTRLVAALTAAIAGSQLVGAAGPAALAAGRDELRSMVLGGAFGGVRGALAARDTVAQRFGLAYKLGIVDDSMLRQQFDMEMQFGAGAATQGAAAAKLALHGPALSNLKGQVTEVFADMLPVVSEVTELLRALGQGLRAAAGGSP